jgi:hypothetical protein
MLSRVFTPLRLLTLVAAVGALAATASAYWTGFGEHTDGTGTAAAASVTRGSTPTVENLGSANVSIDWGMTRLTNGRPVDGYIVKRYEATSGDAETAAADCLGLVTTTHCTETGVPAGTWQYAVTPVFADNWRGVESMRSGAVNTGPASLNLQRTVFGGELPADATGTLSGFAPDEGISFHLEAADHGEGQEVDLVATPGSVDAEGNAEVTLEIPGGLDDGPYTVHAIGEIGSQASTGVLMDTTPPTIDAFITPEPNAAGWNHTPVTLDGTIDDGDGSGIDFVKGTFDGTDPRTSETAGIYEGVPVPVEQTTTVKFYGVDLAGNETSVYTLEIKIDTEPPEWFPSLEDVQGGVYGAEPAEGSEPVLYYRGTEAGSLRFGVNVLADPGGSGASHADFSGDLSNRPGWSFDSSRIDTPEGGPFISNPASWTAGTTATSTGWISASDRAGNSSSFAGTMRNDSTPPAGGSVDATGLGGTGGRYSSSADLNLSLAKGADADSGIAETGARLLRASAPLASADSIANGACGTYGEYEQVDGDDPAATISDTVPADGRCYRYRYRVTDNVGNPATYTSPDIKVSAGAPASLTPANATITPVSGTASQLVAGSTVFYNPAASGSFNVDSAASDATAGVANVAFPTIAGFSGGGNATSPITATTFRRTYSWSANAASPSPGQQGLTATNHAGTSRANTSAFSLVRDAAGPSGGSVDAVGLGGTGGRWSTSTTLSIGFDAGTDSGSGLALSGAQLQRASATLSSDGTANGSCGTFGSYTQVGSANPTSPRAEVVTNNTCYRYRYVIADRVGNQTTYTSPDIKIAATAPPAPALSASATSNAYWSAANATLHYRPSAPTGGFTLSAASADTVAGIAGYAFPALGSGWTDSAAGSAARSYAWSATNPSPPSGQQAVTATTHAGRQSTTGFTVAPDADAPGGGAVTYLDGYTGQATVVVSFTGGTDSGAGVDASSGRLLRASAPLENGACGQFGEFESIAASPSSPFTDATVASARCYRYRYLISDRVGNQASYAGTDTAKVDSDNQGPAHELGLADPVGAFLDGTTLYYKGNTAGSFKLVDALSDPSGGASVSFPAISTFRWTHGAETVTTPAGGPFTSSTFSWIASPTNPTGYAITGRDNVNNPSTVGLTFFNDTAAPTGGSVDYTNGLVTSLAVPISTTNGNDAASGVDPSSGAVRRAQATLNASTQTCGTFGSYSTTVNLSGGADTGVTSGYCYKYNYLVSDRVGNQATFTSSKVARVDTTSYSNAVLSQSSLVNFWRLGESELPVVSDAFAGTAGATLQSRSGEIGAEWSSFGSHTTSAVISDAGRARRNGTGASMYSASGIPGSPNYSVQADVHVRSLIAQDAVGVVGRATTGATDNFYLARWSHSSTLSGTWEILKVVNGSSTRIGSATTASLSAGQTYRLELRMSGSTISLWVNGSQLTSATDTAFTGAGRSGLRLGYANASPAPTNTTGLHADNFKVMPLAGDSKGTNHGTYGNQPTVGVSGAISDDFNTAVGFDGSSDHVSSPRQVQDDLSIEFWFKSTQGRNTNAQWWGNAGMVDAEVGGAAGDFGVSLRSDGRVVAGVGSPDVSIVSPPGFNDGDWHHVAFTRTRASGALNLYIDGSSVGSATGSTLSLTASPTIDLGRIATGGNYFAGSLDEVAIYNTALSAAVVADHYARR